MATNSKKLRVTRELGLYFAEKGKILPAREYKRVTDRPKFLSLKEIVKVMGSYTTAVNWIDKYEPELWDTIHSVKPEPVSPLEKLAQQGKKNGKDI